MIPEKVHKAYYKMIFKNIPQKYKKRIKIINPCLLGWFAWVLFHPGKQLPIETFMVVFYTLEKQRLKPGRLLCKITDKT